MKRKRKANQDNLKLKINWANIKNSNKRKNMNSQIINLPNPKNISNIYKGKKL